MDSSESHQKKTFGWRQAVGVIVVLAGLFGCYILIVNIAASGFSRMMSTSAIIQSSVQPADTAVRITPKDPEAHYTRALSLVNLGRLNEAVFELKQATELRPYHYYEWLDLGVTLDRIGDQAGAISALQQSINLAPSFAQPRWQLGNLLYNQGKYDEAFVQLRLAANSNPALVAGMLELAWAAADGNVNDFEKLIAPQSARRYLQLASFLAKRGKGNDAARNVKKLTEAPRGYDLRLLHETISTLLDAGQFTAAYAAWAVTHDDAIRGLSNPSAQILNGKFVQTILQDDPGFGWQLSFAPNVSASIDPSGPTKDTRSLCLLFNGESAPSYQPIRQLVLLAPNTHYTLKFKAKSEQLVTGGPPIVVARSADTESPRLLGQSEPLSPGTTAWADYQLGFSTDEKTSAVIFGLQRTPCNQSACPVFGKIWLSGFALEGGSNLRVPR